MDRHTIAGIAAAAGLGLALLSGGALAQQKTIKSQLVGTWNLLLADDVKADGSHLPLFGPNPMGLAIFTPDGHVAVQIMRVNRPRFASNNRAAGTADENKAAVAGTITYFGTYAVDEGAKTFTTHVEASSYPNWDGLTQKRTITAITDDVLTYTNPAPSTSPGPGDHAELAWKKAK
jgi:hypothetical protein